MSLNTIRAVLVKRGYRCKISLHIDFGKFNGYIEDPNGNVLTHFNGYDGWQARTIARKQLDEYLRGNQSIK